MISPGELNKKIAFMQWPQSANKPDVYGKRDPNFGLFATSWAKIQPLDGRQITQFVSMTATHTHRIICRYVPALDTNMQICYPASCAAQFRGAVQTITINNGPTGGTFTLTWEEQTTGALAHNISAADLQTALAGLSNIGAGNIGVTGSDGQFVATFQGNLYGKNRTLVKATSSMTPFGSIAIAGTRIFNINSLVNIEERNYQLEIMCSENLHS